MPVSTGTRLGPYEIESPLGAGGMGEVYKARDTRLDRPVAIKILHDALAADPALTFFEGETTLPWELLYEGGLTDDLDWRRFWGMRAPVTRWLIGALWIVVFAFFIPWALFAPMLNASVRTITTVNAELLLSMRAAYRTSCTKFSRYCVWRISRHCSSIWLTPPNMREAAC